MNPITRFIIGISCVGAGMLVTFVLSAFMLDRHPQLTLAPFLLGLVVFGVLMTRPAHDPAALRADPRASAYRHAALPPADPVERERAPWLNRRMRVTIGLVSLGAGPLVTYVMFAFVYRMALSRTLQEYPLLMFAPIWFGVALFVVFTTPPPRDSASAKRERRVLWLLFGLVVSIVLLVLLAPFIMLIVSGLFHGPG
jgi:hypothetical protein